MSEHRKSKIYFSRNIFLLCEYALKNKVTVHLQRGYHMVQAKLIHVDPNKVKTDNQLMEIISDGAFLKGKYNYYG